METQRWVGREVEIDWEGAGGGNEYDQKTINEPLKESINMRKSWMCSG